MFMRSWSSSCLGLRIGLRLGLRLGLGLGLGLVLGLGLSLGLGFYIYLLGTGGRGVKITQPLLYFIIFSTYIL